MKSLIALIAALLVLLGINSTFAAGRRDRAAVAVRRIVRAGYEPGLQWKLPFVQQVLRFTSASSLDTKPERYLTSEEERASISYVKWKIDDVALYYGASGGVEDQATLRLTTDRQGRVALRVQRAPAARAHCRRPRRHHDARARQGQCGHAPSLGIQIADVRIMGINFPEGRHCADVGHERMRAERKQVTNDLRARGKKAGETIQADADRQREVLLAEASARPRSRCAARAMRRPPKSMQPPTARIPNSMRSCAA